jgi:hypothetical protein
MHGVQVLGFQVELFSEIRDKVKEYLFGRE